MGQLTDNKVFEREWDEEANDLKDYRYLLPDSEAVRPIHLMRQNGNALVDIAQRYVVHSPDGFEWGYGGSGPSDLALNILGLFVPAPEAWRLHHDYKWSVIARLDRDGPHEITAESVIAWLRQRWTSELGANY